ncbi:hypothetical protein ES703_17383 [subsurface metagenome]
MELSPELDISSVATLVFTVLLTDDLRAEAVEKNTTRRN